MKTVWSANHFGRPLFFNGCLVSQNLETDMPWIESHQELEDHPKLMMLCEKAGISKNEAIGLLHRLWWWTLKYAEDGELSKYKPCQYLSRLESKQADKLHAILLECGFIDKDGFVHDWWDYAGRYLKGKYKTSKPGKLEKIRNKSLKRTDKKSPKLFDDEEPEEKEIFDIEYPVTVLNEMTGSSYRASTEGTKKLIVGRYKDGYTKEDFKTVIEKKFAEWGEDEKMKQYLRPSTLFRPGNFESYLNQPWKKKTSGGEKLAKNAQEIEAEISQFG